MTEIKALRIKKANTEWYMNEGTPRVTGGEAKWAEMSFCCMRKWNMTWVPVNTGSFRGQTPKSLCFASPPSTKSDYSFKATLFFHQLFQTQLWSTHQPTIVQGLPLAQHHCLCFSFSFSVSLRSPVSLECLLPSFVVSSSSYLRRLSIQTTEDIWVESVNNEVRRQTEKAGREQENDKVPDRVRAEPDELDTFENSSI